MTLPTSYQQYIHVSKYARFRDDLGRRETWTETVDRYMTYFKKRTSTGNRKVPWDELREAIINLEVMPSMRCLMTAGEALDIDNCAGYNCAYITIDQPKAFDEIMYCLMCFEPETLVTTRKGPVAIALLQPGDEVLSYDETRQSYVWKSIVNVIETPSSNLPKLEIELENGQVVRCTENHQWLTSNRGWIQAKYLTEDDDLVA
ncbi:MAG: polymorphic toxin-type HINT domain-containing protein, partial [Candidatus Dormibacteria bacterium]